MPRTREFDVDDTVTKAIELFWEKGFEDTSVRDLVDATGVAHAGLYAAFGDKRGLFEAALRRYVKDHVGEMFAAVWQPGAGRAEIEIMFRGLLDSIRAGGFSRGCFLANTAVEFAGRSCTVGDIVRHTFEGQVGAFRDALDRAQRRGEIGGELNLDQLSSSFTVTFYGLSSLTRAGVPVAALEQAVEAAIGQMEG